MRATGPAGLDARTRARPRASPLDSAWRWMLAGCAAAIAVSLWLRLAGPAWHLAKSGAFLAVVAAGLAAVVAGMRWHRPARPEAWWLLVAAFAVALAAQAQDELAPSGRFPSHRDAWYLLEYLLLAAGMLVMARARIVQGSRAAVLDALIVTISLGLVALRFVVFPHLVEPFLSDPAMSLAGRVHTAAYLLGDFLLLGVAVLLVAGGPLRPLPLVLLLAGVGLQLIDDTVSTALMHAGGSTLGVAWLYSYACIGAAALHPSMRALTEPLPYRPLRLGKARVAVLVTAALIAPLLVQAAALAGHPILAVLQVGGTILLGLLVYTRIADLSAAISAQALRDQRLLDRTVRAKEEERLQIAADLHDGPIQRLAGMGMTAELAGRRLRKGDPDQAARLIDELTGDLGEEVVALRRVMVELRPPVLEEWGLPDALADHAAEFQRHTGINCVVSVRTARRVDRSREMILYRVTQEALVNVVKHARAANVWIELSSEDGTVELTIRDDGAGFDPATLNLLFDQGHFGLAGIRHRAELGGGSCTVQSKPGRGTTIRVRLPATGESPASGGAAQPSGQAVAGTPRGAPGRDHTPGMLGGLIAWTLPP